MPSKYCLVCGSTDDEVAKMHRFPLNENKSKIWQEQMGMKYTPNLRNYAICSRHFTVESYANIVTRKLLRYAVPTLFSCGGSSTLQPRSFQFECENSLEVQHTTAVIGGPGLSCPVDKCETTKTEPSSVVSGIKEAHIRDLKKVASESNQCNDDINIKQEVIQIDYVPLQEEIPEKKPKLSDLDQYQQSSDSKVSQVEYKYQPHSTDEFQTFGNYVASVLRSIKSKDYRRKVHVNIGKILIEALENNDLHSS